MLLFTYPPVLVIMNIMIANNDLLTLKEAVERYRQEERAVSNSYNWYRKQAQESGETWIGGIHIPALKQNGIWHVYKADLSKAINNHRESIKHLKEVTEDYRKGIIHGTNGDTIHTEFGGYEIRGDFYFVWDDAQRFREKSYGTWYCKKCQAPAETKHNKEECHLCSDWNGCGEDCTLSRVYCKSCGASLDV